MKKHIIACFDVYYYQNSAQACCIVFETKPNERIISQYGAVVKSVDDYVPGEFYRRELPCLLSVYKKVEEDIDLAIVDGFVWLGNGKKGLGGYFFEALNNKVPVIGVAKTFYQGCRDYREVYRGKSSKPLFISSTGIDLDYAADLIKNLKGENRLPNVLKKVDGLTRDLGHLV